MSIVTTAERTAGYCLLMLMVLGTINAQAEMGKGTVQDPITREYTSGVYKDWQEGVVLSPETGDYIITYKGDYDLFYAIVFEPATKIEPRLTSTFAYRDDTHRVTYRYRLKNGAPGKQNIGLMRAPVSVTSAQAITVRGPANWFSMFVPTRSGANTAVSWDYMTVEVNDARAGLPPGKTQDGFEVDAADLPGVVMMRIRGSSLGVTWIGDPPDVASPADAQFEPLNQNDFIPLPAAVPSIPVPTPYDAAVVLTGIKQHLNRDLVPMKLIEPVFAGQLDRLLDTAIQAARQGNTDGLRYNLKALRKSLKGFGEPEEQNHAAGKSETDDGPPEGEINTPAWPHPIAKLAARVLDFDFKYVEERVGKK